MTKPFDFLLLLLTASLVAMPLFAESQSSALNDTGITYAGDYPAGIREHCDVDGPDWVKAQDCASGADAMHAPHRKSAFRYRKIGVQGEALDDSAKTWHCVEDLTSGLMWEVKSRDEKRPLHHTDDSFTWYNSAPAINGGDIGNWNASGDTCFGYQPGKPRSYCHIEQFASRVNRTKLCGRSDWRVPTRAELTSLVHFGHFQPAISRAYFPFTRSTFYWTVNAPPARALEAWTVDFEFGTTSPMRKTDLRPVRLVTTARGN